MFVVAPLIGMVFLVAVAALFEVFEELLSTFDRCLRGALALYGRGGGRFAAEFGSALEVHPASKPAKRSNIRTRDAFSQHPLLGTSLHVRKPFPIVDAVLLKVRTSLGPKPQPFAHTVAGAELLLHAVHSTSIRRSNGIRASVWFPLLRCFFYASNLMSE